MAILHSINSRAFAENNDYSRVAHLSNFTLSYNYILNPTLPIFHKMSFTFRMSIDKSLSEERMLRRGSELPFNTEDDFLRSKINNQLKLEDLSGNMFPIDDIFFDNHDLPTRLRPGEFVDFFPDRIMRITQERQFKLCIKLVGDDPRSARILLNNPIIVRLDKSTCPDPTCPYPTRFDRKLPDYYRGMDIHRLELEFEILCDSYSEVSSDQFTKSEIHHIIKDFMKENIITKKKQRQKTLSPSLSKSENKAIDSLRDMLSEKDFRKYIINGFIMVRGSSGKWYQIFKKQSHIRVYEKGILIKELCIHTDAKEVPPTDHVINIKTLVECDEHLLWSSSNVYEPDNKLRELSEAMDNLNATHLRDDNVVSFLGKLKQDKQFFLERSELAKRRGGNHVLSRKFV